MSAHPSRRAVSVPQEDAHSLAVAKGFYELQRELEHALDGQPRLLVHARNLWLAARLALVHAEVSEALECVARGRFSPSVGEAGKPEGLGAELADIELRLADLWEDVGLDRESNMATKHEFNKSRSIRHGGKSL